MSGGLVGALLSGKTPDCTLLIREQVFKYAYKCMYLPFFAKV